MSEIRKATMQCISQLEGVMSHAAMFSELASIESLDAEDKQLFDTLNNMIKEMQKHYFANRVHVIALLKEQDMEVPHYAEINN